MDSRTAEIQLEKETRCLSYFNAAGATSTRGEDHDPELHLIPIVLQVAMGKREKVSIFGADYPTRDQTCVRDYIHVVDLAQYMLKYVEWSISTPPGKIWPVSQSLLLLT